MAGDALIRQLIGILEKHALFGIGTLLDNNAYQKVFKVKLARAMDYPYTLAFYNVMQSLFTVQDKKGWQQPVDFIFDEQGKQISRALAAWNDFVKAARPEDQRRLGQRPVSGDDKVNLPLQAADLLAWRIRREWMDKDKQSGADYAVKLFPLSLYIYVHVWTEEKFQMQMAGFQRFKRATGRKFLYDP
jgi:hypothetical protein